MTDLRALLAPIRERLSRAEDSAVTCQGDGLDKDYIHALEAVSVDAARLLAAIEAVDALAAAWQARGEHLRKFAETIPEDVREALDQQGADTLWHAGLIRTALAAALGSDTTNQEGSR